MNGTSFGAREHSLYRLEAAWAGEITSLSYRQHTADPGDERGGDLSWHTYTHTRVQCVCVYVCGGGGGDMHCPSLLQELSVNSHSLLV